jgi:hypothetical protein
MGAVIQYVEGAVEKKESTRKSVELNMPRKD